MRLIRLTAEHLTRIVVGADRLQAGAVRDSALAMGSFDGVHRGHLELIREVQAARQRRRLAASCLFTFRRHPRLVLDAHPRPFLLTTWREKLSLLSELDLDVVVAADFCPALARLSYREFVETFLVRFLGMRHLVAGHDVHLGADRGGNAETLDALGQELGYTLEVVPPLRDGGRTVSSSAVRRALGEGDLATATLMLGRPYALWGEVTPGEGRGRSIGFPTANVAPLFAYKLLPAPGVYAVKVHLPGDVAEAGRRDGELGRVVETLPEVDRSGSIVSMGPREWVVFGGMLNFGHVPTFHEGGLPEPRVEAHVFEFDGDLRGRTIKVEWLQRLRPERRFAGPDELIAQLRRDEQEARALLFPA
jgi:riboflavin kinase/FMN adenylyltransferase